MTKKEMEVLTEMIAGRLLESIVERLLFRQQEIDDAFIKQMSEHEKEDMIQVVFHPEEIEETEKPSQKEIYLQKIKDLQKELFHQEDLEHYEVADTLKKTIEELNVE